LQIVCGTVSEHDIVLLRARTHARTVTCMHTYLYSEFCLKQNLGSWQATALRFSCSAYNV